MTFGRLSGTPVSVWYWLTFPLKYMVDNDKRGIVVTILTSHVVIAVDLVVVALGEVVPNVKNYALGRGMVAGRGSTVAAP